MVEKGGKEVTTSEIAKVAKGRSKRRKKNLAPSAEVNVEAACAIPPTVPSALTDTTVDITSTIARWRFLGIHL